MSPQRTVAVAQTIPIRGDVDANIEEHLRLVRLAADGASQVLVFPELSLTGYELDLADRLAFTPEDDLRLRPLLDAAAGAGMILIVGAPVRIEARLHIGAFILAPDRSVDLYTKRHLGSFAPSASRDGVVPPAEATVFHPGDRDPTVRFGGTTGAVAVCADTGHPSHAHQAAVRGATTYFASMFVIPSELDRDATNLRTYAARHALTVAFANYGGPSGGLRAAGRSAIWSETGAPIAQLEAAGAGVAIASENGDGWHGSVIRA